MKPKLLFLLLLFCFIQIVFSQNAPSIEIGSNSFSGKRLDKTNDYYETLNYIDYTRRVSEIATLKLEITTLFNKIKIETDPNEDSKLRKELVEKEAKLVEKTSEKDKFWNEYVKDYLENNSLTTKFGKSRTRALFDLIYHDDSEKRFNLLNNTGFNVGNNTGSIYSELVSGHMYLFRVSLGLMVASNSSTDSIQSKQEEAFQRLSTYGGNTVLKLEYPIIYAHTNNNQAVLLTRLIAKGTADFPEFGTTSEDWAGSASIGIDVYADIATSNNKIRFFTIINWNQYYGTSTFQENLGLENDKFSFGQVKVGLTFSNVSLSFIVATFSNDSTLENRNVIAGGQILH